MPEPDSKPPAAPSPPLTPGGTSEPARSAPERVPKMAKPQPKPKGEALPEESEAAVGSGSATGFVSMLAKRQFEMLSATASEEAARRDRLQMAREVAVPVATEVPEPAPPRWYRVALPVSLVLAVLLLGIGVWAIGALVYMHHVTPVAPQDVHYPLISWRLDIGNTGDYTRASRFMAWAMVLCVPVAVLLLVMAWLLRQRVKG